MNEEFECFSNANKQTSTVIKSMSIPRVFLAGIFFGSTLLTGCNQAVASSKNHTIVSPNYYVSSQQNRNFWLNKTFLTGQLTSINKDKLIVSNSAPTTVRVTPQTLIWSSGKMIPYHTGVLKQGEWVTVIPTSQDNQPTAKEIYGPANQIWGTIEKVSDGHLVVSEVYQNNIHKPTGQVLNMYYDERTYFDPQSSPQKLKIGQLIQTSSYGSNPEYILIFGLQIINFNRIGGYPLVE